MVRGSNLAARFKNGVDMFAWTFNHLTGFRPRRSAPAQVTPTPQAASAAGVSSTADPALAADPHLAARRAQALRSLFPKLSSWYGSRRDALLIGEINEYLSQASNVTDLEQRIRVIEQQRHFS